MYLAVFAGGAAGSLLREALALEIPGLPLVTATFGINTVSCLILGWLFAVRNRVHAHVLHLGAVGFCGGLSTFSSFIFELDRMVRLEGWTTGLGAMALEIAAGLAAAVLGEAVGRRREAR
ncbi:camphor resistance protein CrcB [Ruegeria marina]|uniref:Fluoride-specific ion channel FluC n=2 Tax=Ruegeria marina TaxID=639004 RepID=A0A1G6UFN1_9RHOB|nr:camphor resistance protein CrcB [Ruegeria marina]